MLSEEERLAVMTLFERGLEAKGFSQIAGVDEVGRGPLAGPVLAAACILPKGAYLPGLNDSKKLTPQKREELYQRILALEGVSYGVGEASVEEIDALNILQATFLAMQRAIQALPTPPDYVLVDGNRLPKLPMPALAIVQGDGKSVSIAAASIIAKVLRDAIMEKLDALFPDYGLKKHKGYGTREHLNALRKLGRSPIHRKSFQFDLSETLL